MNKTISTRPLTRRQQAVLSSSVKHVSKTPRGYRLQPANPRFKPIAIPAPRDPDDPAPDFRLAGPVVGVVRKLVE